jgi:phosphoribosylglycinamide formyltransferase-1
MEPGVGIGIMVGPHGRGSNMAAIVRACQRGEVPGTVLVVVPSGPNSGAESVAQELRVRTEVVLPGDEYASRLLGALKGCEWLCLAGYLRILPTEVLAHFSNRVLNIHPSLLPKFGGKGMYGRRVHEAVLAAGATESGCSVHIVTEVYDDGPVILQKSCPVLPDDSAETLAERVLKLEHLAYPEALAKVIYDRSR